MKKSALRLISLLFIAVPANRLSVWIWPSLPPAASFMSTAISLILLTAMALDLLRPLIIVCELTPCSTKSRTSLSISPASTTTEVVPSPTSASWERAISVRTRAAGWTMSRSYIHWKTIFQQRGACLRHLYCTSEKTNLHHRRAVICNRLLAVCIYHQQISSVGTKGALDRGLDRNAGIDVREDLSLSLRGIRA